MRLENIQIINDAQVSGLFFTFGRVDFTKFNISTYKAYHHQILFVLQKTLRNLYF